MPSFTQIPPLSMEIPRYCATVNGKRRTDGKRTAGQKTENLMRSACCC